jgi:hypothetical protein
LARLLDRLAIALWNTSKRIQNYLEKQKDNNIAKLYFVAIKGDSIFINNIEIITKKAKLQFIIFELLLEHYFETYVMKRNTKEFLSVRDLIKSIESKYKLTISQESQIRRSLNALKENIESKLGSQNHIIETVPWKGHRLNINSVKLG